MSAARPFEPLTLRHGPDWPNRFMLAPLTNRQSHADGTLGEDELTWLARRAEGGFGLTMTCAAHVRERGVGFQGQLGIWSDRHLEGLKRLADALARTGTHSAVQLHHAGLRTPPDLIEGAPEAPSDDPETGARALDADELERVKDDFVAAARRAERAGFHGVELHGAHGYLLSQFLSPEQNHRQDQHGGSLENRSRLLFELVDRIRDECGAGFSLGVRLSPERFGLRLEEMKEVARRLLGEGKIDYLDLSLWDVFKLPEEDPHGDRTLLEHFTSLERGEVKLGAAGKILTGGDVRRALALGLDFLVIGRAGILHHDYPRRVEADPDFEPVALPVSVDHLRSEGVGEAFVDYLRLREGFVAP
ncbi:MAG: NADH:flavin oxidoreductase [Deltaproteobacteria bacterium]|nr:NADH:flavin oxidoreductase [Deltaproteobacteria bacterium]